jgi:hypothetical protein
MENQGSGEMVGEGQRGISNFQFLISNFWPLSISKENF